MERFFASLALSRPSRGLSLAQSWRVAVSVAIAYYLGAQIGLALTFLPATTSVLWPPNAILTAALLLVPVRSWWVCLGAAFPVHVALETGAGFSPALVGFLFLTNCSEAIIAAGGLRLVSAAPSRFDTLQRMALFIGVAGFLAPLVSSCADAAVVSTLRHEPYWNVWQMRVFANTLTELSVVPAVILGFAAIHETGWPPARRLAEAVVLLLGLILAAVVVFGNLEVFAMPGVPRTPTVLLLPLFFWAATRFGVAGVSAALLVSALVASVSAAFGHRPFDLLPPHGSLMAVQMYLTVMGVPLMCLAALLDERRRDAADLSARLRFEALLATISASFVRPMYTSLSSAYDGSLARIGEFFDADSVVLIGVGANVRADDRLRQWRRPKSAAEITSGRDHRFAWLEARLGGGDPIVFESLEALPAEAASDRQSFADLGMHSAVIIPFATRETPDRALAVGAGRRRIWGESDVEQIRLLAEVVSHARAREEAEFEVQRIRHELAQVARLASMGELTSSLAHELNQPLTGILSNAQAATRFLDDGEPSLVELRAIVSDIIDDDRRARDVLKKMREMLTREVIAESLDLNSIVRDVAVLITSETIIRNVSVTLDFAPEPVLVIGARVELQQAVLNVLTNAMEAVADRDVSNRVVHVRIETFREGSSAESRDEVRIIVQDSGSGLTPGSETRLFEPFFTIKASGVGMGLAVARSIVENHGGAITAVNGPRGGAVVCIALPLAQQRVPS